jgi:iron complex transport system substrate-binding protein
VIVTQDLCEVCAVSLDDVRSAVARLAREDVEIVNLHPTRLEDIWADIGRVADAIGRASSGAELIAGLRARVESIRRRAFLIPPPEEPAPNASHPNASHPNASHPNAGQPGGGRPNAGQRPRVLTIEWMDPVMIGGMWMPELVTLAGGRPLVTRPGDHAPTFTREGLASLEPDVVLIKPCGFELQRTVSELPALRAQLPSGWRARIYAADGNAYFNRPGPRIVESLEILAACIHPHEFHDFARKHEASFRRWNPSDP